MVSEKADTSRTPSPPNELIALVISSRVNRVGVSSKPEGLLGPNNLSQLLPLFVDPCFQETF